jgi:anti-anti-sigma factor
MALEEMSIEQRGSVVIAHLSGEIGLSNAAAVTEQLVAAMPNSATALVLEMSGTSYLDSSGVRLIFELAQRLSNRRQKLKLVVPDDANIRRVLVLTEVERVVPMSTSVEAAVGD